MSEIGHEQNQSVCRRGFSRSRGGVAVACAAMIVVTLSRAAQGYDPQSDGSDGVYSPTGANPPAIDLRLAATATWDTQGSGNGVYDPDKWAVVFKYSSVNIPTGTTVTFINHPKGAPVVWLVSGSVVINGTLKLDGANGQGNATRAAGGPGGFAGGVRRDGSVQASSGEGPGGGLIGNCGGGSGGFGQFGLSSNGAGGSPYGSPLMLPLIGGSGGAGYGLTGCSGGAGGGGGGGAILIAAGGTITINGTISANGGTGNGSSGLGSGGGIRLIADQMLGIGGVVRAYCGDPVNFPNLGYGRVRVETLPNGFPPTISVVPTAAGSLTTTQGPLFPPSTAPKLRIASVQSLIPAADPFGSFGWFEDVLITNTAAPATVIIQANNVTPGGIVHARLLPEFGTASDIVFPALAGDTTMSTAMTNIMFPAGRSVIQLRLQLP